jgi:hypothetical protein
MALILWSNYKLNSQDRYLKIDIKIIDNKLKNEEYKIVLWKMK